MEGMKEMWNQLGSMFSSLMFFWVLFERFFPTIIHTWIDRNMKKAMTFFDPYVSISFHEYSANGMKCNEAYEAIQNYLTSKSTIDQARKLRGEIVKSAKSLFLTVDDNEEVHDFHEGIKVSWRVLKQINQSQIISSYSESKDKRYYKLTFHNRYRDRITSSYVNYVLEQGRDIEAKRRQRKLFTNNPSRSSGYYKGPWSHVTFEHPATFETLAMDPVKKKELMDELVTFSKSKEYYERIGRSWKRGYLLYGPPGTGKSTLVAAIANFVGYDVYDLELTAVSSNNELRKLLTGTTAKSIILIEDIDCSLNLTGQRKNNKQEEKAPVKKVKKEQEEDEEKEDNTKSKVTLSGLLNFIDGLWSAGSAERLIIFTTNYVEKLDSALIRSGRMDRHIELSYCDYEAFKVLARNYLGITSHPLFSKIKNLLEEVEMTPADVAENLMPKTMKEDTEASLESLTKALETSAMMKLKETTNGKDEE
ncbi:hypothetical protein QQ045_009187 [Rhodiola kirilowii]